MTIKPNSRRIRLKPLARMAVGVLMFAAGALVLLLLTQGQPAFAAAFVVNSTADAVDFSTADGVCDTDNSAGDGPCTLRAAIQQANANPSILDTIDLPAGTYTLSRTGPNENASATGDLDIIGDLTITGAGAGTTIIQGCDPAVCGRGNGSDRDRVVHVLSGTARISGVTIQNGTGARGGGIWNVGTLILTSSTVRGNTDTVGYGGGIYNTGTATLTSSTVRDNTAAGSGGGIRNFGMLVVNSSTVRDNTAGSGGGIMNDDPPSTVTLNSSTVSGNTASAAGGGMTTFGILILNSSTVSGNSAPSGQGGGIWNSTDSTVTLKNSIVADNPSGGDCHPQVASAGHNLDSDGSCGLSGTGDRSGIDPRLVPLALNPPGSTETHRLCAGINLPAGCGGRSPAIDAGLPTTDPDCSGGNDFDQRGVSRPQGPACDIGAYEAGFACDLEITKTVSPNPVPSGQPVSITLTVTNAGTLPCDPGPFPGTVVRDSQPAGLTFLPPDPAPGVGWTCTVVGGLSCGNQSPLLPGYAVTVPITARAIAPGTIQNCATVTNPNDTNAANNTSCVTIQVARTTAPPGPVVGGWTTLRTLNPAAPTFGDCNRSSTSGGLNAQPVWVVVNVDLSAYANQAVAIRWLLDTGDSFYNRHEGWFVDNISIGGLKDGTTFTNGADTGGERNVMFMGGNTGTTPGWHATTRRNFGGGSSWWYGNEATGTIEGQPDPNPGVVDNFPVGQNPGAEDNQCNDRTNFGQLFTPVIQLGAAPSLSFRTLWDVESVNVDRFDLMRVQIQRDKDSDGLLDDWETAGLDLNLDGVPELTLPGANPSHKDIYVELDYMVDTAAGGHSDGPKAGVVPAVVAAFAAMPIANPNGVNGINLHVEVDDLVPHEAVTNIEPTGPSGGTFDAIKAANFDPNRKCCYHYNLWAHQQPGTTSSGRAELPGNDFLVTLGTWPGQGTVQEQSGTFMHELGHNLNLKHGGSDHLPNYKPQYQSVMNYFYQVGGMMPGNVLRYSYEKTIFSTLNEAALFEPLGVLLAPFNIRYFCPNGAMREVPGGPEINWNCKFGIQENRRVKVDLNGDGTRGILTGHDDRASLDLVFGDSADFADGAHNTPLPPEDEIVLPQALRLEGDPAADTSPPAVSAVPGPINRVQLDIVENSSGLQTIQISGPNVNPYSVVIAELPPTSQTTVVVESTDGRQPMFTLLASDHADNLLTFEFGFNRDLDGDGFTNTLEDALGSDPLNAASKPEHFSIDSSCHDTLDNDLDGKTDFAESDCIPRQPFAYFPPAGLDVFNSQVTLEADTQLGPLSVVATGPTAIRRGNPGDSDENGLRDIDTEIVSMQLTAGPITIVEDPANPSFGTMESVAPGSDFPADSSFDLSFIIQPKGWKVGPCHVAAVPPVVTIPSFGSTYEGDAPCDIFDQNDNQIGTLTHVSYAVLSPTPPPVGGVVELIDLGPDSPFPGVTNSWASAVPAAFAAVSAIALLACWYRRRRWQR